MENYELGELPEPLRAWAKFRPADSLDFSRRAKSLATALELPLQKTQDAYAVACGFSGRHELQQVLKQDGTPGPYDDVIPADIDIEDKYCLVQFYRHARLLSAIRALIVGLPKRYFENRDKIACDLSLFSTPGMHLRAVQAATAFLSGSNGYSPEGFPFGYRGNLHQHYLYPYNIDEPSLLALSESCGAKGDARADEEDEWLLDPRAQRRALLSCRAPSLFKEMAEDTAAEFTSAPHELVLDEELVIDRGSNAEQWLLTDVGWMIAHLLCNRVEWKYGDSEFERLHAAIQSSNLDDVRASCIASAIPDFIEAVPLWRLSIRYQIAKLRSDDQGLDWDRPPNVQVLESVRHPDDTAYWISIFLEEVLEDISVSRWRLTATLLTSTSNKGPWVACACLMGDYIIASSEDSYDPAAIVIKHFDCDGEQTLSQAWRVLRDLYLPVAGFLSYHEWINDLYNEGGSVAVVEPWVAPAFRGTDMSFHLLDGFARAFDDGNCYVVDSTWRDWLDPREDNEWDGSTDEEEPVWVPGALLISLPGSGMLGYSVWGEGEEPATKILRLNGARLSRNLRGARDEVHRGLGPHLLQVAKRAPIDVVLFDPRSRSEDDDEG